MDLHLTLDRSAPGLATRLAGQLRGAIRDETLAVGTRMPATRALAADLGISRGVVVEAYERLTAEGLLVARTGSGTEVAAVCASWVAPEPRWAGRPPGEPVRTEPVPIRFDLRPGMPDLAAFPRTRWLGALREALMAASNADLGYPDPSGTPALRGALADYLGRVRGAVADSRRVVIVSGVAQALALIGRILTAEGRGVLAVEDPGSARVLPLLRASGLDLVPVPVDSEGIDVAALAHSAARAVLVTPAHQYPTGVVLSPRRRAALVAWARERDGLVVEDDYDAEFRYDKDPVSCVQGLAPEHVALTSSVSKTLAPGLRLGWVLAPQWLAAGLPAARALSDLGSPVTNQEAFARFITCGAYDRHIRSMRRSYRSRRDALIAALQRHLPALRVRGVSAGLHLYAELPPDTDDAALVTAAAQRGVAVDAVAGGLMLGYAALSPRALEEAVALLAEVAHSPTIPSVSPRI